MIAQFEESDAPILREIVKRLVRIENRLEQAGVLPNDYDEDALLFVLENGLPVELLVEPPRQISLEFYDRVVAWMEAHEHDLKANFPTLEVQIAGSDKAIRGDLMTVLQFFVHADQWCDLLVQMTERGGPLGYGTIKRLLRKYQRG